MCDIQNHTSKTQSSKTQLSVQALDRNNINSSHDLTNIKSSTRLALAISVISNNFEVKLLSGHHGDSKMFLPKKTSRKTSKRRTETAQFYFFIYLFIDYF